LNERAMAHIAAVLRDDVLSSGFSICPASKERDKWIMPTDAGNAPVAFMQQVPLFASTDVLLMCGHLLRNWNMAISMARPFVPFEAFTLESTRVEKFRAVLPRRIRTGANAIGAFLLHEAEKFNEVLAFLKTELARIAREWTGEDACAFGKGFLPRKWRVVTRLWTVRNIEAFESHLVTNRRI
jgi:hypothetical protein